MVIFLLNELIEGCQLESDVPLNIPIFETIADCYKHSFHFLAGDRVVLENLSNNPALSENARSIYKRLYLRYTTESSILNVVNFKYNIGTSTIFNVESITIDIQELSPESFICYNSFLVEYPTDVYIYSKMIDYYIKSEQIPNIQYVYTTMNGGGNTISPEFDRLIDLKRFFNFCLIDSDKVSPNSTLGSTASDFEQKPPTPWGKFEILPVHEIENLIPRSLYISYIESKNDGILNRNLNFLRRESPLFYFLDTKKGINKSKVRQEANVEVRHFYLTELELNEDDIACACTSIKNCSCHIISPFGRTILEKLQSYFNENGIDVVDHLCSNLDSIYKKYGKQLFEIFCKPQWQSFH